MPPRLQHQATRLDGARCRLGAYHRREKLLTAGPRGSRCWTHPLGDRTRAWTGQDRPGQGLGRAVQGRSTSAEPRPYTTHDWSHGGIRLIHPSLWIDHYSCSTAFYRQLQNRATTSSRTAAGASIGAPLCCRSNCCHRISESEHVLAARISSAGDPLPRMPMVFLFRRRISAHAQSRMLDLLGSLIYLLVSHFIAWLGLSKIAGSKRRPPHIIVEDFCCFK